MPRIKFPVGLVGTENLPRTQRRLLNVFYNGEDLVIGRPGIRELADTKRVARGNFEWNGNLYAVVGQDLIKFTDVDLGLSVMIGPIASIAGSAPVVTENGFNDVVILVPGTAIYTLDKADVLTDITNNTNFVVCDDVAHINGRFVYIPSSGDPAFFSDVGAAGTVQASSFFDAEELPDRNRAVWNFRNTLYIAGTDSIELFRDTGTLTSSNPFTRVNNARILNGFIGGELEYNQTYLFFGREKGQDLGIYALAQGAASKISNEFIDSILTTYTDAELAEAIAGRLKWRGYDLATFTLRRHSFGFYGGNWFALDTVFSGISRPWGGGFIQQFQNKYYTAFQTKIGVFDNVATDYGERITRVIDTAMETEDDEWFAVQRVQLSVSQGFNSGRGSIALFLSRDNVTYGPPLYRETGALGQYAHKMRWQYPGGLGSFEGFMGLRFYTTEDINFSADYIGVLSG